MADFIQLLSLKKIKYQKGKQKKGHFEKLKNPMVLKDHLALVIITLQEHLRDSQKE